MGCIPLERRADDTVYNVEYTAFRTSERTFMYALGASGGLHAPWSREVRVVPQMCCRYIRESHSVAQTSRMLGSTEVTLSMAVASFE